MNYFTKEELKEITETLIANPTKETLKQLSDKYNQGNNTEVLTQNVVEEQAVNIPVSTVPETIEVNSMPDSNTQTSNETVTNNIPSFSIPQNNQVDMQTTNTNVVNEVPFNGNLWAPQAPEINNMMQTTNNFNNIEASEMPAQEFQDNQSNINNQPLNQNMTSPTMFGQIEQNINNVA